MLYILTAPDTLAEPDSDLAGLLAGHPQWTCTRKLDKVFELQSSDELADIVESLPTGWSVREMTYASIDLPGVSLRGLQARLAKLRAEQGLGSA